MHKVRATLFPITPYCSVPASAENHAKLLIAWESGEPLCWWVHSPRELRFLKKVFKCVWVFCFHACICIMCVPGNQGGQRRDQICCDWSYRPLRAPCVVWLPSLGPLQKQQVNHLAVSPVPSYFVMVTLLSFFLTI